MTDAISRRSLLTGGLGLLFLGPSAVGCRASGLRSAAAQGCEPRTEPNIEGPFFREGAPTRDHLAPSGAAGTPLQIAGTVRDPGCRPMSGAVLDVWHADAAGEYDLAGYTYRGQLRCDEHGRFRLSSVVPGAYRAGSMIRPAHVHVRVHASGRPRLTTQLYFPNDPHAAADPWIRDSLILRTRRSPQGVAARFDFVV